MENDESLKALLQCSGELLTATKSADVFAGLEQSAQILLDATETTDVEEALHVLEQRLGLIRNHVKLVECGRDEELLAAIRYLQEVEPIPGDVVSFLIQKRAKIITCEEDYKAFMSLFKEFKEQYTASYIEEHQLNNKVMSHFCEDFEENLHFKLLLELDAINDKLPLKPPKQIYEEIKRQRSSECGLEEQRLRVILNEHPICTCEYRPRGTEQIREETADREHAFFIEIQGICIESLHVLLSMLNAKQSRLETLLMEKTLTDVGHEFLGKLEAICEKPSVPSESDLGCLLDHLGKLASILQEAFRDVAPPPRPRHSLSTLIGELRAEKGQSITIGALVEWFRQKYGETEEIDIDLP